MSVKAESLDNQERGLALSDREVGNGKDRKYSKKKEGQRKSEEDSELDALQERLSMARLHPVDDRKEILEHDRVKHCGECFARGWSAAVKSIGGEEF